MQVPFSCQTVNKPDKRVNGIVVATYTEISKLIKKICETSVTIKNNFAIFKHPNNAPKPG